MIKTFTTSLAALILLGSTVSAGTVGYTEGLRHTVDDTTHINSPDVPASSPGFDLGILGDGDTIEIYGRIVNSNDVYEFTANTSFRIDWIFGGYALEDDNPFDSNLRGDNPDISGFVARPEEDPGSDAAIFLNGVAAAGNNFSTNITGGDSTIFGVNGPGTYTLFIDGINRRDALYDIRISAVPIPTSAFLLLAGVGAFGALKRRKS